MLIAATDGSARGGFCFRAGQAISVAPGLCGRVAVRWSGSVASIRVCLVLRYVVWRSSFEAVFRWEIATVAQMLRILAQINALWHFSNIL
jgi:hypothetical protein